jgi:hypothetical protein
MRFQQRIDQRRQTQQRLPKNFEEFIRPSVQNRLPREIIDEFVDFMEQREGLTNL